MSEINSNDMTSYIENNYLTINQLANQAKLSLDQLSNLIAHSCIPKHSHTIIKKVIVHSDIFGESVSEEEKVNYFHPSLIDLAIKADQYSQAYNFIETAEKMKADFIQALYQAMNEIEEAKVIFKDAFDEHGNILSSGIESIMIEHWPYMMDGTYGVCLKEISAKNMILKNIAVSLLEKWVNASPESKDSLYDQAQYASELYDSVASSFGPHEITKSTRSRLFNTFKAFQAVK